MNRMPRHQRGVALLVALLVVALAVIMVAALLDRGELAYARTRNALRAEQAAAYAQGLDLYAAQALLDAQAANAGGVDSNASPWAMPLPPQPVPGGTISASMRDLNGCFNLNNLAPAQQGQVSSADWSKVFSQLLAVRGIDPGLVKAVVDWLDPNGNVAGDGIYLSQSIPYRPAHRNFAHVSELRLVAGVSGDVYARLAPYVCALPPGTRININTASVPVLQSLVPGMTQATAERLWQNGSAQWTVGTFKTQLGQLNVQANQNPKLDSEITSTSTYFLMRGDILLDDVPFTFHSLIERSQQTGIRVLERSRGSDAASSVDVLAATAHAHDDLSD